MQMQIIDIDYFFNGTKPVLRLFGKTESGNAVCLLYDRLFPYFYIKAKDGKKLQAIKEIKSVEFVEKLTPVGYTEKPLELLKITTLNPQDVPKIRDRLTEQGLADETYEADIMFKYRFMIDHKLKGVQWVKFSGSRTPATTVKIPGYYIDSVEPIERMENADLRLLAVDIECLSTDSTKPLDAKHDPVIMIAFAFEPEYRGRKSLVLVSKPVKEDGALGFQNEKDMLAGFLKLVDDYDPDMITGYNINGFDMPYLLERLKKLGLSQMFGRCKDKPAYIRTFGMQESKETTVPGRVVVDSYQILKRDPWVKFHRYNLDTVAKALLQEQKHDVTFSEMGKLWQGTREELKRFIEYARNDAELSLRLITEKRLVDKFFELSKISGLLLQDCLGGQASRVEMMLLHEFKEQNFVMPSRPSKAQMISRTKEREKKELKGATVLEPEKGLHTESRVLVLDFKSLYPSIMRTYNISPDTLLHDGDKEFIEAPTGAKFVCPSVREGILPNLLRHLLDARAKARKEMKSASGEKRRILNAKQLAFKDLSNSVHASTDIVVKDPSGKLRVCEIEELFNELVTKNVVINLGNTEVIELDGWETLSVEGDKSCFKPFYAISRHRHAGNLTKIKTPMCEAIITDDHSIMVMKGKPSNRQRESIFNRLIKKGGKEVSEEDIIAQVRSVELPEKENLTFNWLEFLKSLPEETTDICLYVPKHLKLKKKNWLVNRAKMLSAFNGPTDSAALQKFVERRILRSSEGILINRTGLTTVGHCGLVPVYEPTEDGEMLIDFYGAFLHAREEPQFYSIPIRKLSKLPKFIERHAFLAYGGPHQGRRKLPINMPVTEELAELLGWFVAEGSTYRRKNSFSTTITNYNKQNLERIRYLVERCFGYSPKVYNNAITISTKLLYLFFRHLCGPGSHKKQVPSFILNSNKRIRSAFMYGYYSGDGNTKIHRINTKSKLLCAQLNLMLKELGGVQYNSYDGLYRLSRRKTSHGYKIVSGGLFGQRPKISRCPPSEYVYDLSVRDTEMFVTAQGAVLHNSFYGYTGYARARLYMLDVANAITAYGRENLVKTKKMIEENFPVRLIYADTDSAFLKTTISNLDEAKELGEKIALFVTDNLPGHLELQFEKIYKSFLILTKKRYAGWMFVKDGDEWKDTIEMKGIETVRRDWCPLVSQVMEEVIRIVLKEGDTHKAIAKMKEVIDKLRNNEIPPEELTIVKGITKSIESYEGMLPHIELAKKLKARRPHEPPRVGDRLGFVIIKGNQMLSKRAEDPDYVKAHNLQIDSDYYIQSQLFPPIERIFSAIGVERGELLGNGRQMRLGDIMNGAKRRRNEIKVDTGKIEDFDDFVCKKCNKSFRRAPLQGSCECGGEILISYHGSTSDKVLVK